MKKYLLVLLIGLFFLPALFSDEGEREETLVFATTLFGNAKDVPLHINSDRNWIDLSSIDTDEIRTLETPVPGVIRKWRIKTSYSENSSTGQSTIQIKLRNLEGRDPLFTMPWSEGTSEWKEEYSNWFQTDFEGHLPLLGKQAVSSVRLIAPPGTSIPGVLYKIELEAWDVSEIEAEENINSIVQMASTAVIPRIRAVAEEATDKNGRIERKEPDKIQALQFALNFINGNLNGDLPAFYNSLNDTIFSLQTGLGSSKYRVPPPANVYEGFDFSDYTENYETSIYDYSEYTEVFPQWVHPDRSWNPDRTTYLFHGSAVRENRKAVLEEELLVFMIKMIDGEWKLIAVPE